MAKFSVRLKPEDRERLVTFEGHGWATFGRYTYGHFSLHSWPNSPPLRIGNFCSIALGVELLLGGEHNTRARTQYPLHMVLAGDDESIEADLSHRGPITIGHDVWLCTDAKVLSGVTIGNGAVVAAGAVVTRDVAPYTIVAGNPAKLVRPRFAPDVVAALEAQAWWSWPIERIRDNVEWLCSAPGDDAASAEPRGGDRV